MPAIKIIPQTFFPSKWSKHPPSVHQLGPAVKLLLNLSRKLSYRLNWQEKLEVAAEGGKNPAIRSVVPNSGSPAPQQLPSPANSLFHDRPIIKNGRLYFISAHEAANRLFKSWFALYSTALDDADKKIVRITPHGSVDYRATISPSGKYIAVASYGSHPWPREFHDLQTDIVVFPISDPSQRVVVCQHGGWPTWSCDSIIYFHRQVDDGWWSIFRVDLLEDFELSGVKTAPLRVTQPVLHCFTPEAMHGGRRIVVPTRRHDRNFWHIEIFDLQSQKFHPVTELLNPNLHHYNPFVSFVG